MTIPSAILRAMRQRKTSIAHPYEPDSRIVGYVVPSQLMVDNDFDLLDALSGFLDLSERVQTLEQENQRLQQERDEADRQAGQLLREMDFLKDTERRRNAWRDKAKREAGFCTNTSFDEVWAEMLRQITILRKNKVQLDKAATNKQQLLIAWFYELLNDELLEKMQVFEIILNPVAFRLEWRNRLQHILDNPS